MYQAHILDKDRQLKAVLPGVRWHYILMGAIPIPKDKKLHLLAGLALSLLAGLLFCPLTGFITAAVVGALKEIVWDWLLKKGTPELLDFVATVAGGVLGAVILHAAR